MTLPPILDDFRAGGGAPALTTEASAAPAPAIAAVPHVVAWNLTARCNLACAHCYISAGPWHGAGAELTTDEVRRIADEILAVNPAPMFILSGGEPLLRDDLEAIAAHATAGGATVVVGTNGTRLTGERIASLQGAGVRGVAVSVDSLDERYHDRFRHGGGALADTLAAVERLREARLDFLVQTTVTPGNRVQLASLAAWAADAGAVCFNVYFLVETGRGEGMRPLTPAENDEVLGELVELGRRYRGTMMVRSKCQPQIMRHVWERDPASPLTRYATRCPCGVQYCRITPEGKVTPCPYLPAAAGDLRRQGFAEIWRDSRAVRAPARRRAGGEVRALRVPGRLRRLPRPRLRRLRGSAGRRRFLRLRAAGRPAAARRRCGGELRRRRRARAALERRGATAHRTHSLLRPRRRRRPGRGLRPPSRPRRSHRRPARPRPRRDAGRLLPAPPLLLPPRAEHLGDSPRLRRRTSPCVLRHPPDRVWRHGTASSTQGDNISQRCVERRAKRTRKEGEMAYIDCLNWVGEGYSLSAFAAEAAKRGCSRKVSSWPPWLKPGLSRVFLAHRGGHKPVDLGVVFGYFELAGADVVMSPVRAGEALALASGAPEPSPALLDFWEGELSTRLRSERTAGARPRRRAPDPERASPTGLILDALLDCERPPVPIPHAFGVSTLQSGLEEERECGFRPHGKLTEAKRSRVDTWWGAESGLYLVDALARRIDRELCELIKELIKAALRDRGRSVETVKGLHRELLADAEKLSRAGSGREGRRRRAGTPSFQEAVARAAAAGGFAPPVPPELAEHCEVRGPLVLFRRPYPVYQRQKLASFRNYLRIDGDDLLAQIAAHYRGKDDHKIELPLYVDLNRPLKWESTVTLLARHVNLDKTRTATVFEEFVRLLAEELASGQPLRVPALGVFDVRSRAARVARVPGRDQPVTIPARQQIRFRAAAALKRDVGSRPAPAPESGGSGG